MRGVNRDKVGCEDTGACEEGGGNTSRVERSPAIGWEEPEG